MNYEIHANRMLELYGLKRTALHACPRVVAGKRCRVYNPRSDYQGECACQPIGQTNARILDHARVWKDQSGQRVLTAEPYNVDLALLRKLEKDCADLDLIVKVGGEAPWHPVMTTLIWIAREI